MQQDTQNDAAIAIGQRLAEIRNGKSQGAFADELGIHKNSLGHYERGNRVPDAAVLLKLVEMGFSANWVLTGEGSKDAKGSREALTQDIEKLRKLDEEFALIPGYNVQVAAGHGSLAGDESPTRELAFRRKWLRYRGLHEHDLALVFAKGDSMEPTISDNETVMVDTSEKKLRDGHIYVIRNGDHLLVKRIQTLWNDGVQLLSDNKEYPPQEIASADLEHLEVIGKVVWVGKDL